jgi:hypothetical protein
VLRPGSNGISPHVVYLAANEPLIHGGWRYSERRTAALYIDIYIHTMTWLATVSGHETCNQMFE